MSAHTKGPWIVYDDDVSDALAITCDAREGKVAIALIGVGYDEPFDSEQRANAQLIAAAPELLEALKKLRASYKLLCALGDGPTDTGRAHLEESAAAIAKAKGEA
jgi:FMN phosphatase YigB (HAD superfamily)